MAAQAGKDILLKIHVGRRYQTIAGLRASDIELNCTPVDITDANSPGQWQELLADSGKSSIRVSGEGIFRDMSVDGVVRNVFWAKQKKYWQITLPSFGVITGYFMINELTYLGTFDGEMTWRITLSSAGSLSFSTI